MQDWNTHASPRPVPVGLSAGPGSQRWCSQGSCTGPVPDSVLCLKDRLLYSGASSCQSVVKGCGRRSGPRDGPPKTPPTLLPSFPTHSRVVTLPQGAAAWVRASDWLAKVTGSHPSCQGCGLFWGRGGSGGGGKPSFPSPSAGDLRELPRAFQAPPGSQASSRGEAKDSALLSSRDAGLLEPPERPQAHGPH